MRATSTLKTQEIDLVAVSVGTRKRRTVKIPRTLVIKHLPASLATAAASNEEVRSWDHLKGVTPCKTPLNVELLIGLDVPHAFIPLEARVAPKDRDALHFLWWKGGWRQEPNTYRMTVHLFGGVWSPSFAGYALQRTFDDYGPHFSEEVRKARRSFYVADLLLSVPSLSRATGMTHHLQQLLNKGGFRLTKWICNKKEVLETVPKLERMTGMREVVVKDDKLPTERALGILWDLEEDQLAVRIQIPPRPETKRGF
ncbi:hypothetical protein O3P69_008495 [Scylla paramamosain]|uniref:Uncharacterized protein n=1 Tax=Scylla paramamosain TaxID=85552 RepID=A0AAW0SLX8_SCYPA